MRGLVRAAVVLSLGSLVAARARAQDAIDSVVDCAAPPAQRPPDPRCGETLDGRAPDEPSIARKVARDALWVPRLVSRLGFWPIVATTDVVESNRLLDWVDALLTTDDGLIGVRPLLQYSTGFLSTVGLRVFYRRLPGPGSEIAARFQTAGPSVFAGEVDLTGPRWSGLALRAGWNRRDDRLFAGVGPNSQADLGTVGRGQSRYGSDEWLTELRWARSLPARLSVGLHGDVQRRDYRADHVRGGPSVATAYGLGTPGCMAASGNDCVDPMLVPGFASGLRVAHAGATLAWDYRQHARDGSGMSARFDTTAAEGLAGDPSRHLTFTGETVVAVGGGDRQLLLRGRAGVVRRIGDAPIPFDELISPAGAAGMRGFPEGRFRGESGIVGTAEYRWYIAHHLDASLFTDVGTVAGPAFSGLRADRWFPTFGIGLRHVNITGPYWEGDVDTGLQFTYAPDYGFRALLSVATF